MRFRYEVMYHNTLFMSMPDRPVKTFPLRFLADAMVSLLNADPEKRNIHVKYYVRDTRDNRLDNHGYGEVK